MTMSLKGFHIIFLVLAVLCAFGFYAWTLVEHEAAQELGVAGMGQASCAIGVLLFIYAVWFVLKKAKTIIV